MTQTETLQRRHPLRWLWLLPVAIVVLAFFTNISESRFRAETKDKVEALAGKLVDEQDNALLSLFYPAMKNLILDHVDITITNYYVFSVAYVSLPNDSTLKEWHDQMLGVSVFGKVFFPSDDMILEQVRGAKHQQEK